MQGEAGCPFHGESLHHETKNRGNVTINNVRASTKVKRRGKTAKKRPSRNQRVCAVNLNMIHNIYTRKEPRTVQRISQKVCYSMEGFTMLSACVIHVEILPPSVYRQKVHTTKDIYSVRGYCHSKPLVEELGNIFPGAWGE